MNKPYFCRTFFLTYWRHKRLKNTIDLLLIYGEHFYGFRKVIRSFFWSAFPCIRTEYGDLRIQSISSPNTGKYGPEKTPLFWHFWRSVKMAKPNHIWIVIDRSFSLNILLGVILEVPVNVFNQIDNYLIRFSHRRAKGKTRYFICEWMAHKF